MSSATVLSHDIRSLEIFEKDYGPISAFSDENISHWSQGPNISVCRIGNKVHINKIGGDEIVKNFRNPIHGLLISEEQINLLKRAFIEAKENVSYYMVVVSESSVMLQKHIDYGIYVIGVLEDNVFSYTNKMDDEHRRFLESINKTYEVGIREIPRLSVQDFLEVYHVGVFFTHEGPKTVMMDGKPPKLIHDILKLKFENGTPMSLAQIFVHLKNNCSNLVDDVIANISEKKKSRFDMYSYNYDMIELYLKKIRDFPNLKIYYNNELDNNPMMKTRNMNEWKKFYGLAKSMGMDILTNPKSFLMISRLISIDRLEEKIQIKA